MNPLSTLSLVVFLSVSAVHAQTSDSIVTEGVASAPVTAVRIVGMGFGKDKESQMMKAFFEQGNAYTLAQLQKRFQ
jgi:hypothetical protein